MNNQQKAEELRATIANDRKATRRMLIVSVIAIVAVAVCMWTMPVVAAEKEKTLCEHIESVARTIMQARQADLPLTKLMSVFSQKLSRSMVMDAYDLPHYSTEKHKKRSINKFANRMFLMCLKSDLG